MCNKICFDFKWHCEQLILVTTRLLPPFCCIYAQTDTSMKSSDPSWLGNIPSMLAGLQNAEITQLKRKPDPKGFFFLNKKLFSWTFLLINLKKKNKNKKLSSFSQVYFWYILDSILTETSFLIPVAEVGFI